MTSRVASYNTTNTLFLQAQRLQQNYAKVAQQSASGLRSVEFEGIASDAQRLLILNGEFSNLGSQAAAMRSAQLRVGALQNAVDTIGETLTKISTFFVDVQNGLDLYGAATANVAQATVLRDSLIGILNSQSGGAYLFSGSAYDRAPVNIADVAYNPTGTPASPDYNYYQGDDVIDSVRMSDTQRIDYGVTANNPAFEKVLRALQIFIANPTGGASITQATDLTKQSLNEITGIRGQLLSRLNIITDSVSSNAVRAAYLQDNIVAVRDVDVAAAATQLSQYETQLQASYAAFSKLLQLRLTDYLR